MDIKANTSSLHFQANLSKFYIALHFIQMVNMYSISKSKTTLVL